MAGVTSLSGPKIELIKISARWKNQPGKNLPQLESSIYK